MNITPAIATSAAFIAAVILVLAVVKGWVKLGSALLCTSCGILIGASFVGAWWNRQVTSGLNWAADSLKSAVGGIAINGWRPAADVPWWGWRVLVVCMFLALVVVPVVAALDGAGRSKAKAKAS